MSASFRIVIPPTAITDAGTIAQFTVPSGGAWKLLGIRVAQTEKNTSELHRLAFSVVSSAATGGTTENAKPITRGSSVSINYKRFPFTDDATLPTVPDDLFGWNIVSGEYRFTPVPDEQQELDPSTTYALQLLTEPGSGGFSISGSIILSATV